MSGLFHCRLTKFEICVYTASSSWPYTNTWMKSLPAFLLILQLFNTAGHVTQQTPSALWCQYSMASEHLPHTFSSTTIQEYKDSALYLHAMTGTKGTTVVKQTTAENCPYFPSTISLANLPSSHSNSSSTRPCRAIKSPSQILLSLTWSYTNRKYSNVSVPKINEWKIQQQTETRNAVVYF